MANRYFRYLVGLTGDLGPLYITLLKILHTVEFYEVVPNDINRIEDGLAIREETSYSEEIPCSFLEVLLGLSRRLNDALYDPDEPDRSSSWFWSLIGNLELLDYTEEIDWYPVDESVVKHISEVVIERKYSSDGKGGLFPLSSSKKDQREVELWYQMDAWLDDNNF